MKEIFKFPRPLVKGHIIKRYKRFLADVLLPSGEMVTAHVPNSGSMKTCWQQDSQVILSDFSDRLDRKLKYTLQAVLMPDGWVGVNTSNPNVAAKNAIMANFVEDLRGYDLLLPEVKISDKSRIDLMLWRHEDQSEAEKFSKRKRNAISIPGGQNLAKLPVSPCFIEIKNVTLLEENGGISFPDAVTLRGQKHLTELIELKKQGYRAVILFFVERNSAKYMTAAKKIDPVYAKLLNNAVQEHGVEAYAIKVIVRDKGLFFDRLLPIVL